MDLFKLKGNLHIWSNLTYLIVGFFMGSWWLFLAMAFLAFTSFMGHWKGGKWWSWDWAGMYVMFISIILHNFGLPFLIPLIIPIVTFLTLRFFGGNNYWAVGLIWVSAVASSFFAGIALLPILLTFGLGLYLRQRAPEIGVGWYDTFHSLWHVFTSIGMKLMV